MNTTHPQIETELTQRLAEREALRDRARRITETAPTSPGKSAALSQLAEEISNLSERICFLKCMR